MSNKPRLNLRRVANGFYLFCLLQFFLPASIGGYKKDGDIGHYFTITVNMKKERFELLDSLTAYPGTVQFFNTITSRVKKIWKQISTELQLSPRCIDHFKKVKLQVPLHGET